MSSYHIGSINAQNAQIGDHNTQHNTQFNIHDELMKLDVAIDRYASLLPDVAAAHRALAAVRVACADRPVDPRRVTEAAGELSTATAAAPALHAEIWRLFDRISL